MTVLSRESGPSSETGLDRGLGSTYIGNEGNKNSFLRVGRPFLFESLETKETESVSYE